jgi:hypothetical protein
MGDRKRADKTEKDYRLRRNQPLHFGLIVCCAAVFLEFCDLIVAFSVSNKTGRRWVRTRY